MTNEEALAVVAAARAAMPKRDGVFYILIASEAHESGCFINSNLIPESVQEMLEKIVKSTLENRTHLKPDPH